MNQIIETYAEFKINDKLPESWVKNVWTQNGFAAYVNFPSEYEVFLEEIAIGDLVNDLYEALKSWLRLSGRSLKELIVNYTNADPGFSQECEMNWQTLNTEGIDHKPIICILGTLVLRFFDDATNSAYFIDALVAARLYLFMVAIPGSHICQIFNSTLYSHIMSIIRMCCEQIDSCSTPKNKGVKRKKGDGEYDAEMEDNEPNKLTFDDKSQLISFTNDILSNLKLITENRKVRFDNASLNLTVQILLMIARLEKVYSSLLISNLNNYRKNSVSYLAFKSFSILQSLAGLLHTNPNESAKLMVKSMAPIFLINELRTLGLNLKDAAIVRVNFTAFLKMLLDALGETAYEAVSILVQRVCVSVPDRAEMRLKASNIVLDILKISPPDLLAEEIYSIVFMSHMSETKIRLFTLEIISKLLLEADSSISFSRLPQKYAAVTSDEFLLAVIFYRCQDISTSIRNKALSYLDQFISSAGTNKRVKKIVDKIFIDPYVSVSDPETVSAYSKEIFDTQQFLLDERFLDDRSLDPLPGVKVVLDMLVYFSQEDKVFIKKCAIQTLARLMLFSEHLIKKELLQVFLVGCDDSSVLVRKTMGQIITDLLCAYQDNEDVIHCWVEGVVSMIAEEEAKAQEKILEHYSKIILTNIMMYDHTTSVVSRLPWLVMKQILATDKRSYLHFAVGKWVQSNAVKNRTIQMIYSHIDSENNSVAWCLLASFSQFMDLPNSSIIFEHYKHALANLDSVPHSQLILETLYYVCPNMSKEIKRELLEELENHLTSSKFPLKLIARSRDICELILNCLAPSKKNTHQFVIEWTVPKIKTCIDYISEKVGKNAPSEIENVENLIKFIFLLGELAQAAPNCVTKNDIKMLQNILLSPRKREADSWKGRACNALKSITVLTLVKLVLQKEETANSIMPIFKEILSSNSVDPTIQVNTIIGMCDLCSRYTTLVERYFTYICKCFNSKHENVRMTALMSVMKRVKEEYVKLRPFILFPMLTMVLDPSVSIKRTIATFIGIDLKKKNNILETFYTGLFYFLNNCKNHSTTVKIPEDLRVMFSLTDRPEDREHIYIYILDKLADPHKRLLVCKKIVTDIIMSVADEMLKLDEKGENILTDAFNLLVDNERKISEAITRSKKGNTEEVEEIEEINEANREPKKTQSSQTVTINENVRLSEANEIIPVIIKLRLLLKKQKSRCMKNLMSYMCELMKNFKNEMADLLQGDAELKTEIEYNLRRIEIEEDERKQAESQEAAESQEQRMEDENRNIQVLTTSPEEICEQLQNLIVQLTRCDAEPGNVDPSSDLQPVVRLVRSDKVSAVGDVTAIIAASVSSPRAQRMEVDDDEEKEEAVLPAGAVREDGQRELGRQGRRRALTTAAAAVAPVMDADGGSDDAGSSEVEDDAEQTETKSESEASDAEDDTEKTESETSEAEDDSEPMETESESEEEAENNKRPASRRQRPQIGRRKKEVPRNRSERRESASKGCGGDVGRGTGARPPRGELSPPLPLASLSQPSSRGASARGRRAAGSGCESTKASRRHVSECGGGDQRVASPPARLDNCTPPKSRKREKNESRLIPERMDVEMETASTSGSSHRTFAKVRSDAISSDSSSGSSCRRNGRALSQESVKSKAISSKKDAVRSQEAKSKETNHRPTRRVADEENDNEDSPKLISGKKNQWPSAVEFENEEEPTALAEGIDEGEWMANEVVIEDDPVEEGQEMFSSDED